MKSQSLRYILRFKEFVSSTLIVTMILCPLERSRYSRALEVWNCPNVARRASTPPKNDKGRPGEPHTIKQRASAPPKYDKAQPKYDKGRAREVLLWMSYLDPLIIHSARTQPGNHFEQQQSSLSSSSQLVTIVINALIIEMLMIYNILVIIIQCNNLNVDDFLMFLCCSFRYANRKYQQIAQMHAQILLLLLVILSHSQNKLRN